MCSNGGFNIFRKVRVDSCSGLGRHQRNALGDGPPRWSSRTDHGNRPCIALDNDFHTGLDLLQNGRNVTYHIGFADAQRIHGCHYSESPYFRSSGRIWPEGPRSE